MSESDLQNCNSEFDPNEPSPAVRFYFSTYIT